MPAVWVGAPAGAPEEHLLGLGVLSSPQHPVPGPAASPEQLSFRERQKYFELEVRVPQAEGPPKRVSLVGADDLRKMQEEEGEECSSRRGPGVALHPA